MTEKTSPAEKPDFNKRVEQFVRLRDLINEMEEEHKEKIKPFKETLEKLNAVMLDHLNQVGADRVGTSAGTVYRTSKKSATIADKTAFWTFVTTSGEWDLLDYKANAVAVEEYIQRRVEAAKDDPSVVPAAPPGVNFSERYVVGVKRK